MYGQGRELLLCFSMVLIRNLDFPVCYFIQISSPVESDGVESADTHGVASILSSLAQKSFIVVSFLPN